ncbi:restriction endonuclease [Effusibacillus lacus]|uniref:Restriction endonuclease n=1 Tax=Effusibacillus lacus TaxID=1348429 RepID=A0A292YQH5_9BACL|nr:restriction endonuclease [Effusibacillus lacus]TCS71097.1 restriction system protein [Effusibacillus lacus]GAX90740.1 restriction endonuclease [Effusibacillus lacus]
MAVPDFQSLMLPFLKKLADRKEHSLSEIFDILAEEFHLTPDDRNELLPSGRQSKFENRVGWARTYMKKAGLLESTARAKFRITSRGLEVLAENPPYINVKYLERFPEFLEFRNTASQSTVENIEKNEKNTEYGQTPEEVLESSYLDLRRELAQELLERVKKCSPTFFERLVVDLLVAMGYGGSKVDAGQAIGRSGDEGIDGIIKEDKLGLDVVYIQAKRWEATVGRPIVQAFAGSLEGQRARKGVLITTSNFSQDAKEYVSRIEKKIVLINGEQLAQLMIDHDIGVSEISRYIVKKIDLDYFGDE